MSDRSVILTIRCLLCEPPLEIRLPEEECRAEYTMHWKAFHPLPPWHDCIVEGLRIKEIVRKIRG